MISRCLLDWNKIDRASKNLSKEVVRSLYEGDGLLVEADSRVNDASRKVIKAFHKTGETWLGKINVSSETIRQDKFLQDKFLWKYEGDQIYNFCADFVIPNYDKELEQLVRERHNTSPFSMRVNVESLLKIRKRIETIKGVDLLWA